MEAVRVASLGQITHALFEVGDSTGATCNGFPRRLRLPAIQRRVAATARRAIANHAECDPVATPNFASYKA